MYEAVLLTTVMPSVDLYKYLYIRQHLAPVGVLSK
jgi:hypothetical protein